MHQFINEILIKATLNSHKIRELASVDKTITNLNKKGSWYIQIKLRVSK